MFLPTTPSRPVVATRAPVARRLRRRQRVRIGALLIPLVFIGIFAGVAGWLYQKELPRLEGSLTGVLDEEFVPEGKLIDLGRGGLSDAQSESLLERLRSQPLAILTSDVMSVLFDATEEGLQVGLRRGRGTQFVRVRPDADTQLRAFIKEQLPVLGEAREDELRQATAAFLKAYREAAESGERLQVGPFRDTLGINTLVGPLGFVLEAEIGKREYRAVYEDGDGNLYFLVPLGTREFQLRGRELADGRVLFPGRFTVRIEERETPGTPADTAPTDGPAPSEEPPVSDGEVTELRSS